MKLCDFALDSRFWIMDLKISIPMSHYWRREWWTSFWSGVRYFLGESQMVRMMYGANLPALTQLRSLLLHDLLLRVPIHPFWVLVGWSPILEVVWKDRIRYPVDQIPTPSVSLAKAFNTLTLWQLFLHILNSADEWYLMVSQFYAYLLQHVHVYPVVLKPTDIKTNRIKPAAHC